MLNYFLNIPFVTGTETIQCINYTEMPILTHIAKALSLNIEQTPYTEPSVILGDKNIAIPDTYTKWDNKVSYTTPNFRSNIYFNPKTNSFIIACDWDNKLYFDKFYLLYIAFKMLLFNHMLNRTNNVVIHGLMYKVDDENVNVVFAPSHTGKSTLAKRIAITNEVICDDNVVINFIDDKVIAQATPTWCNDFDMKWNKAYTCIDFNKHYNVKDMLMLNRASNEGIIEVSKTIYNSNLLKSFEDTYKEPREWCNEDNQYLLQAHLKYMLLPRFVGFKPLSLTTNTNNMNIPYYK